MVLTDKQKDELHKAIAEYLSKNSMPETLAIFLKEAKTTYDPQEKSAMTDMLEKKWVSVIRLQKKCMELEAQIEQLKEQAKNSTGPVHRSNLSAEDLELLFPKTPAKYELQGHRGTVTRVAFHPQYSMLATCGEDAAIKMWDLDNGQLERTLKGHTATINDISFDQQGKYLASCSSDLTIKLYDLTNYQVAKTLNGHDHSVSTARFLPSGDFLISASRDKSIKLWDVSTGYCVRTYLGHDDWVRSAISDESGKVIASCSSDQKIIIWNVDNTNPHLELVGHEHVIESIIFVQDDVTRQAIAESNYYKSIIGKDEEKKDEKPVVSAGKAGAQKYHHLNFLISASRDKTIMIWNAGNGVLITTLTGHDNWVRDLAFHHSGKYLYSCSDDKSIRIWDLSSGKCTKRINDAHSHFVCTIAASSKYLMVASASVDKSVKVWECK
mmetsp:Transcript_71570/g.83258  ORF Transcript_71570/g.83258 Transcript_71570/m.83258 type:complete len:439 (+) Transcript_71570:50-1366(+)